MSIPRNKGKFSHLAHSSRARMVDVGGKPATTREARAEAWVQLGGKVADALETTGAVAKGNVLETARLAGIMAAKQTSALIPLCHPLALSFVDIEVFQEGEKLHIVSCVRCTGSTGVEMEAMTAVSVAALTVYDMCKSATKGITIGPLRLLEKSGGKSGSWKAES